MTTIEEYIIHTDAKKTSVFCFLRQLIFSCSSAISEEVLENVPHYNYFNNGLCYINTDAENVILGFCSGTEISDPFNILQNGSKESEKTLSFKDIKDIDYEKVIPLLQQAILINELHYRALPNQLKHQTTDNHIVGW
jgi:hypothetical protein